MRFNLYKAEIIRETGKFICHVVAPSINRASEFLKEHHEAIGLRLTKTTIYRVDDKLDSTQNVGLEDLLESAPVGLASYSEIGWILHVAAMRKLRLFRIGEIERDPVYIIAPDINIASAIYLADKISGSDQKRSFKIYDGLIDLAPEMTANIHELLEFGPAGTIRFENGRGWYVW